MINENKIKSTRAAGSHALTAMPPDNTFLIATTWIRTPSNSFKTNDRDHV
jgi:hypothetical protein